MVKVDNTIKAKFNILSLALDKSLRWRFELDVQKILPKSYHDYSVTLVFDEEPFEKQIAEIEQRVNDIESDNQLFIEQQKKDINFHKDRIESVMEERDKKKKECPTIETFGQVESVKYRNGNTVIKIVIPDDVIQQINERKMYTSFYRLELKPMDEIVEVERKF